MSDYKERILNTPKELGKYKVLKTLGRGSVGVVHEGIDPFLNRRVAIKIAYTYAFKNQASAEHYKQTFFNEAHTAGKLKHANIIEVLDAGVEGECCYIVMELVSGGRTLETYCNPNELLDYMQVADIISKCAKALDYAHRIGVIHRDIKPNNILLTKNGDVKICDFSIAYLLSEDLDSTIQTGFAGSPRYMSPEQMQEDIVNSQTDLFSLGIVMYELLTGRHPFAAKGFSRLIYKIINEKAPPLKKYRPDLPEVFQRIIYRVLQKHPEQRYKTGLDLAADVNLVFDYTGSSPQQDISKKTKLISEKLKFFSVFSEDDIVDIIQECEWQEYQSEQEIICREEIADSIFLIISGKVNLYEQDKLIKSLKQGDYFGKAGKLLAGKSNDIKFYAQKAVQLMKINSDMMDKLSISCQLKFNKLLLKMLIKNLL